MADTNQSLYLPDEIPGNIVQYLTIPQLRLFKQLSKQFNKVASHAIFLQPLYNRLYALDKTLPPILSHDNASLEFKQAFEQIKQRQNAEIEFFVKYFDGLKDLNNIVKHCHTIEELEERDAILNVENIHIIGSCIDYQNSPNHLNLSTCITRFIIDETRIEYFKNLTSFTCQDNLITTINLENHPNLKLLDCRNNPCLKEVYLFGCSTELDIHFDHSEKPNNIFSEDYDHNKRLLDLAKCGANLLFRPTAGILMFGAMCIDMGGELLNTYNTAIPPKIFIDDTESQNQKEKFLNIEEARLFKLLKQESSPMRQTEIIQTLGDRYTTRNCLKYGCIYQSGIIMGNETTSMFEKTSNLLFSYWEVKKEEAPLMIQQETAKRKREYNPNEEPQNDKKQRLDDF